MKSRNSLLIIFIKNPQAGKVKKRLAAGTGHHVALQVYRKLLFNTQIICDDVAVQKAVCYSDFVDEHDHWPAENYLKFQQQGEELGERMKNAFKQAFAWGYEKVVLIGGDIVELNAAVIREAFRKLDENEVVMGPAKDGGYYLIGMKKLYDALFSDMHWGESVVYRESLLVLEENGIHFAELQQLADLDSFEDFQEYKHMIEKLEDYNES